MLRDTRPRCLIETNKVLCSKVSLAASLLADKSQSSANPEKGQPSHQIFQSTIKTPNERSYRLMLKLHCQ